MWIKPKHAPTLEATSGTVTILSKATTRATVMERGGITPNAYPLDGTAAAYDMYLIHGSNIPEIVGTPLTIVALFLLIFVIKFKRSMGNK